MIPLFPDRYSFKTSLTPIYSETPFGDSLALTLVKCSDLEDKLLDALNDEAVLSTLRTAEKERLLGRVTIAKGVTYAT